MSSATPHLLLDGIDEPGLNTLPCMSAAAATT